MSRILCLTSQILCLATLPLLLSASTYDLRFHNPEYSNCDGIPQGLCVTLQIKAAAGEPDLAIGAHTIAFYYNHNALNEPQYTSLNFNHLDSCALGGFLPSYGEPQFSFSTVLGFGEANVTVVQQVPVVDCPIISSDWLDVGRICFDVLDAEQNTDLQFNTTLTLLNLPANAPAHEQGTLEHLDIPAGCSVGINTVRQTNLQIYPNPAIDRLHLQLTDEKMRHKAADVVIFDLSGKVVDIAALRPDFAMEVGHLQTGAYFLSLRLNSGKIVGYVKFFKL